MAAVGQTSSFVAAAPNGREAPIPDLPVPAPGKQLAFQAYVGGIRSEWPDGLEAPQLGGYMRELEREGVRTPCCARRLVQDRQILTWTTWPSRLVLNGRPLVLNSCSMGVFSGSTSATKVRSPAARAILVRLLISALPIPRP